MKQSLQYRGVLTSRAEPLVTGLEIPMESRLPDVGYAKSLSVKPLVQVNEESELQMSGLLSVTLFRQKGCIGGQESA
jgi:hypothetical protein